MADDNSRKLKQNQIIFCIEPWIVEFSRSIDFGEDQLRERGSLLGTFYILTWVFSMANDKSRKFKQNQIMFCIQPWIVEFPRPIGVGEDLLRERGSLPATFYVLTGVIFYMTNDDCRKFKQTQLRFCIPFWTEENSRSVDFVEDRLRETGSLPATFYVLKRVIFYDER